MELSENSARRRACRPLPPLVPSISLPSYFLTLTAIFSFLAFRHTTGLLTRKLPASFDGTLIPEDKPFSCQRLGPKFAIPLILSADAGGEADALVTANQYRQGVVVLMAPDYMMASGSQTSMLNMFTHLMEKLRDELLPIKWRGEVEVLVNRNRGGWVVTLINNEGVIKKDAQEEAFDDTKQAEVWLRLEKQAGGLKVKKVAEWVIDEKLEMTRTAEGTEVVIMVPPGDVRILEFSID